MTLRVNVRETLSMILHVEAQRNLVREQLKARGVASAHVEADLLLAGVLGISRGEVQMRSLLGREVTEQEALDVASATARRARREPLQHVLGVAPFLDMELAVGPGVFVPRPETESSSRRPLNSSAQPLPGGNWRVLTWAQGAGRLRWVSLGGTGTSE